ncbi:MULTISPECIES: immunoglobulin domain-containing protein [unclassified Cryobacterium]|uniref:immunoglobulin domain-containing protein n=1 Tax=unclassified Cryobacterium TaxID=2649013 RepID=UPI002AB3BBC8|nr:MULTISPECIES: immunoglobulin domain-containing protein [unclassified Cryobacterium]MDY7528444.1 immunoglobulin domain-containing protein [Cryobacterium sp. 10C2]MDY7555811.1 immunoglobulin domain-containing protein [Cryobacterium sp. 10C3]MEB0289164.1 immunoglobulin domain-containing protein [Cryobacterium sp. 10C2]
MTEVLFEFVTPTAAGVDIPAVGVIAWSLTVAEVAAGRTRTTEPFTAPLVAGRVSVELSPTGPGQAWRISPSWLRGLETFYKAVPLSTTPLRYDELEDIDPRTLVVSPTAQTAWDATIAAVQAIADSMTPGGAFYIDPTDSGILRIRVDVKPVLTLHPTSQTVNNQQQVTLDADATGNPAPTVQWQVDAGAGWVPIAGATSKDYSFTATEADNGKKYRAVFTNGGGQAATDPATLTAGQPVGFPVIQQFVLTYDMYDNDPAFDFDYAGTGDPAPTLTLETRYPTPPWNQTAWTPRVATYVGPSAVPGLSRYSAPFVGMFASLDLHVRVKASNTHGSVTSPEKTAQITSWT